MATYYELLGVGASATDVEIKSSYRKLAIQLHPDKNPDKDTGPQFTEVTKAYETLRDPVLRQQYDQSLLAPKGPAGAQPGMQGKAGMDFTGSMNLGEALSKFFENLGHGDFQFNPEVLGEMASRRGRDIVVTLKVTPQEVISGGMRKIKFKRSVTCTSCKGITSAQAQCPSCKGQGHLETEELTRVDIPKGVGKGNFIERPGQGHAGTNGGASGNLVIGFEDDFPKGYERDGADLTREVPVDFFMMILGGRYSFPHIDGEDATFEVPACSQTGQKILLPGRGFPRHRGTGRGDLYLELMPFMPVTISDAQRKLLEEIRVLDKTDNMPFNYVKGVHAVAVIYPQENALKLVDGIHNVLGKLKLGPGTVVYDLRNFKQTLPEVVVNALLQVKKQVLPGKLMLLVADSVQNQFEELGLTDAFKMEKSLPSS